MPTGERRIAVQGIHLSHCLRTCSDHHCSIAYYGFLFPDSLLNDLVHRTFRLQPFRYGRGEMIHPPYARACPSIVERSRRQAIVVVISSVRKRHASLVVVAEPSTALPSDSGAAGGSGREIFPGGSERPSALRRAPHASVARTQRGTRGCGDRRRPGRARSTTAPRATGVPSRLLGSGIRTE